MPLLKSALATRSQRRSLRDALRKDWDRHVVEADELARSPAFAALRDAILDLAEPAGDERTLDVGAGTGLLTLPLARTSAEVCAVDVAPAMVGCLRARLREADLANVRAVVASAARLPLADRSVDLAVSNYCLHHLTAGGKRAAVDELYRVLAPGGRLVFADMMFSLRAVSRRDWTIIAAKAWGMVRRGPAGVVRLARNAARVLTATGEHPASPAWWERTLREAGFVDVRIDPLAHEGGIAQARKPA